jgi:predicted DNA repair protein MutK
MKTLSVLGTAAMFLVGGGILVHGFPPAAEFLHYLEELVHGGFLGVLVAVLFNGIVGVIAGGIVVGAQSLLSRMLTRQPKADAEA